MSKELEALSLLVETSIYGNKENNRGKIFEAENTIKQALTPPTEQEVVKALSEYYGETIIVNPATLELVNIPRFANDINKENHIEVSLNELIKDERYDLITMICQFYEGRMKNE